MPFMDCVTILAQKKICETDKCDTDNEQVPIHNQEKGVFVICPECDKSTELVVRADYPRDSETDEAIRSDDDLVEPDMTHEFYELMMKDGRLQQKSVGPPCVAVCKYHGECKFSNKNLVVLFYTILDHDLKVGGFTFRIIKIFNEGEKIKNVYEVYSDSG